MRTLLVLLALLCLPAAAAETGEDCDNDGVFVQAGVQNGNGCGGDCANSGVMVVVGVVNQDDCGTCDNDGLYAQVGGGCGEPGPEACLGDLCACLTCPREASSSSSASTSWCSPVVHGQNVEIYCGDVQQTCGVAQEPDCWAVRLVCFFAAEPAEQLAPPGWTVYCPRQP